MIATLRRSALVGLAATMILLVTTVSFSVFGGVGPGNATIVPLVSELVFVGIFLPVFFALVSAVAYAAIRFHRWTPGKRSR